MKRVFSVVFLTFAIFAANAQEAYVSQETKERWRLAAEELLETYIAVSIDPYRGITKGEWDKGAAEFLVRIDSAATKHELYYALRYFGALSNDGHFNFPDTGVYNREKFFRKDDPVFPVMVRATPDDRVFVVRDFSGSIPDYAELLAVNGFDTGELSHRQHRLVSYEPNYAYAYLNEREERDFRAWVSFANYLFCENIHGPFEVKYTAGGEVRTATVEAMGRHELHKMSKPLRNYSKFPLFAKAMEYTKLDDGIAVLDIDYFWGNNPFTFIFSKRDRRFERVLRRNMRRVSRDRIEYLVVDLRSNSGGYAKNVYELMSYFAPDMVYDDRTIYKVSAESKVDDRGARILESSIKMIYDKENEELRQQTVELYKSMPEGAIFREDTLMPMTYSGTKSKYPYSGKVYVLTNSASFSASMEFCNYFRKSGVGLIAGEPPAGYTQVTGGARIPIRNELTRYVPMKVPHIVSNPLGEEDYHYLIPDIPIDNDLESWIRGEDDSLFKLLEIIRQEIGRGQVEH